MTTIIENTRRRCGFSRTAQVTGQDVRFCARMAAFVFLVCSVFLNGKIAAQTGFDVPEYAMASFVVHGYELQEQDSLLLLRLDTGDVIERIYLRTDTAWTYSDSVKIGVSGTGVFPGSTPYGLAGAGADELDATGTTCYNSWDPHISAGEEAIYIWSAGAEGGDHNGMIVIHIKYRRL